MATKTEIAWAAGIVDGEGCITITRRVEKRIYSKQVIRYVLVIKVTMGHRPTVARLVDIFGHGTVQIHVAKSDRVNASYSWIAQSRKAQIVLEKMRPYLLTKAAEADIAVEFANLALAPRGGHGGGKITPRSLDAKRERFYWAIRRLKSRWRFYKDEKYQGRGSVAKGMRMSKEHGL